MVNNLLIFYYKTSLIIFTMIVFTSCSLTKNDSKKQAFYEKENNVEFVFAFFDAGETLSLLPVIKKMDNENISYKIMPLGKGAVNALQREKFTKNVVDIQSRCSSHFLLGESVNRKKLMDQATLNEVASCYHAKIIVTGMVSNYQSQLVDLYKNDSHGILIGYYDGFADPDLTILTPFLTSLNKIFVPSKNIFEYLKEKKFQIRNIEIVGQPALDKFIFDASKVDIDLAKNKLKIKNDNHIVTFIGGYGIEYQEVFKKFVPICKDIKNTICVVGVHPAVNGDFEEKIMKEYDTRNFILNRNEIPTVSLVKISDVLISQRSTVGIQSLFIGIPSIYFDVENATYTNIAVQQGWSPQIKINQGDLKQTIEALFIKKDSAFSQEKIFSEFIPLNAKEKIYSLLLMF